MSNIELTTKVHELRELRRMAAEIESEIMALQNDIKAHMAATGSEELSGVDYRITWKNVESTRFDKAAMIQTFGQSCYDGFCKTMVSRRFVLA